MHAPVHFCYRRLILVVFQPPDTVAIVFLTTVIIPVATATVTTPLAFHVTICRVAPMPTERAGFETLFDAFLLFVFHGFVSLC